MQLWDNKARLWLLRTLTVCIIWIYSSICQPLSSPLYNTHPTWLSLTNELKFVDKRHQINSLSLVNLLLLINKFSFICEGQSCRVRIINHNPKLVWIMAWCRIGDKPLSEPMLTRFTDTYMQHYGQMRFINRWYYFLNEKDHCKPGCMSAGTHTAMDAMWCICWEISKDDYHIKNRAKMAALLRKII